MTSKSAVYSIDDGEDDLGVVRCADGDREEFFRLAAVCLSWHGTETEYYTVAEPEWRWYRRNPCVCGGDHAFDLGCPDGPGRGNWRGAMVRVVARAVLREQGQ